jgi:purine-nucleoside phosphorylase
MSHHSGTQARPGLAGPTAGAVAESILRRSTLRPTLGLVLGSGFQSALGGCTRLMEASYSTLPGFPRPGVAGHEGKLLLAYLARVPVVVLSGRAHYYEGGSFETITFPIRVLAHIGVTTVLLTCAAGGINSRLKAGDYMALTDHLNLMGGNPLRGWAQPDLPRFVDLTETYDPGLKKLLDKAARKNKVRLHSGVYAAVSGPSYETPAEIRAFGRLGADAVGMSMVPEAIVARQCGLRVAGLACITNLAAGRNKKAITHAEVLLAGEAGAAQARGLIESFASLYAETKPT